MSPTPGSPRRKKKVPKHPTWEHPTGSGIKIAEMPNKTGGKVYGVSYQIRVPAKLLGVPGKREMHQRQSVKEAERLAEDRFIALKKHGTEFARIPADAQRQAAMAWGILSDHIGRTKQALNFIEVVKAGIRAISPEGGRKTIAEVFAELRASKAKRCESGTLDKTTLHDFVVRSKRIESEIGARFAGDILRTDIEALLAKLRTEGKQFGGSLSLRSLRNYRNTLAERFRHATARQYCSDNPFERFTREDFKTFGGESSEQDLDDINVLTVDETTKLLAAAHEAEEEGMLASVVLRLFCGLRTAEVCRLDWSEVHWLDEKPYVHIPGGKAKKRRIRQVDIPENALAWLKLCNPPAKGRIVIGTGDAKKDVKAYCTRFARVAKLAGIGKLSEAGDWESEWESNDTRHSYGSYHYALYGDALKTAAQMGHKQNDDVLFAHYRQLVRKDEAAKFFAIIPSIEIGTVTQFPKAAAS